MRIDDDELRDIFQTSSEERIQTLDNGLLHLERHPHDLDTVEAMLREAHSLKGDSNMLGQEDLGKLAHHIESVLSTIHRGEQSFTPDLGDRLSRGIDAIRLLVEEAVTGQPSQVNLFYVLADLMGGEVPGITASGGDISRQGEGRSPWIEEDSGGIPEHGPSCECGGGALAQPSHRKNDPDASPASFSTEPNPEPDDSPHRHALHASYRIETVRVPTHNLDSLMTQAGELTVTKIRIAHRLAEAEAISNLWEEWNRDIFLNRSLLQGNEYNSAKQQQLQHFFSLLEGSIDTLGNLSKQLSSSLYEDITRLESISDELEEGIRTLRLLPLSSLFNLFPRMVRDLARQEGKRVHFVIDGGDTKADKRILEDMKDPLLHLLRNAIDHGIETPEERVKSGKPEQATLRLQGYQTGNAIVIEVSDDGRGLDTEAIKETALRKGLCRSEDLNVLTSEQIHSLILSPGFSTRLMVTDVSGRGVGLDVLRTNVETLKGHIEIQSQPGQGCTFRVQLGTTLATAHVLIVSIGETAYALPVEYVEKAQLVYADDVFSVNHQPVILHNGHPISVISLAVLLECRGTESRDTGIFSDPHSHRKKQQRAVACIILKVGTERFGIFVDALLDEQDVVLKPQSQLLKRVRNVLGATILGTGEVCMVLNPLDLLQSIKRLNGAGVFSQMDGSASATPSTAPQSSSVPSHQTVLLVEDSIATRTQEKRILEAAGYHVITAVDGLDGFSKLQMQHFDAVISDVQMPNLDGLGLTERIRKHREYSELPIILVTTLASDDDRRRGAEAGANAYITKSSFSQDILLDTLERLI